MLFKTIMIYPNEVDSAISKHIIGENRVSDFDGV